jgi:hypothetical protein
MWHLEREYRPVVRLHVRGPPIRVKLLTFEEFMFLMPVNIRVDPDIRPLRRVSPRIDSIER